MFFGASAVPIVLYIVLLVIFIPESARYLLAKGINQFLLYIVLLVIFIPESARYLLAKGIRSLI
jgi:hypothetical protein